MRFRLLVVLCLHMLDLVWTAGVMWSGSVAITMTSDLVQAVGWLALEWGRRATSAMEGVWWLGMVRGPCRYRSLLLEGVDVGWWIGALHYSTLNIRTASVSAESTHLCPTRRLWVLELGWHKSGPHEAFFSEAATVLICALCD